MPSCAENWRKSAHCGWRAPLRKRNRRFRMPFSAAILGNGQAIHGTYLPERSTSVISAPDFGSPETNPCWEWRRVVMAKTKKAAPSNEVVHEGRKSWWDGKVHTKCGLTFSADSKPEPGLFVRVTCPGCGNTH